MMPMLQPRFFAMSAQYMSRPQPQRKLGNGTKSPKAFLCISDIGPISTNAVFLATDAQ